MRSVRLTEKLTVAGQPAITTFPSIAEDGFGLVINNRPDGEEKTQPGSAAEERAARDAGLGYVHIPVTGPSISEENIRRFQAAIASADGPVLAHCRSGTRCLALYALGEVLDGRMQPGEVLAFGAQYGFELTVADVWLRRNFKSAAS